MTPEGREALVERMRLQIAKTQFGCKEPDDGDFEACVRRIQHIDGSNPCECWLAARAALSEAERVVREDEREACAAIVDCGCVHRAEVLAVKNENSGDRWRACGSAECGALNARAIRARGAA